MSLLFLFLFFCFLRVMLAGIVAFFCGLFDPATWEYSAATNPVKPVKPVIRPRSAHRLNHL